MNKPNLYFPCELVEHDDTFSVICSNFHYFDDYFGGREAGGYAVERLAKKLVKQHAVTGVRFDSEAGMFCAYSTNKGPLKKLCTLLRKITGGQSKHLASPQSQPSIPLDQAERLLLKGFVVSLDEPAQKQFLDHVPFPALSKQQAENIERIQHGTDSEKIRAARNLNSEARTKVRDWEHYLSHPQTTTLMLDCCENDRDNPRVFQELIWALVFICDRHLPDLRTQPYFSDCLVSKRQQMRFLGMMGLDKLHMLTRGDLTPLLKDKSKKVRELAESYARRLKKSRRKSYPSWMFDAKNVRQSSK